MTVMEAILKRRSVRDYLDKPVEADKIELLLKAAMAAPSACNLQPWEFIIVTDKTALAKVIDAADMGRYNPPMAVVACANTSCIPWEGEDWKIDCSAAVMSMMLAATEIGLGSVWVGGFDEQKLRAALDIPARTMVMSIAYFGYPAEDREPLTYYNPEAVYYDKYDPARARKMRTIDMLPCFNAE